MFYRSGVNFSFSWFLSGSKDQHVNADRMLVGTLWNESKSEKRRVKKKASVESGSVCSCMMISHCSVWSYVCICVTHTVMHDLCLLSLEVI